MISRPLCLGAALVLAAGPAAAQSGAEGFVVTLGRDTVQAERFERAGNRVAGIVALRTPRVGLLHYEMEVDAGGRLVRYRQWSTNPDGTARTPDAAQALLRFAGDSVQVTALRDGTSVEVAFGGAGGAVPFGTVPTGSPFAALELGLGPARTSGREAGLRRVSPSGRLPPATTVVHFADRDSVEVDYFGQGAFGAAFDQAGRMIRSDWRRTTVGVLVTRTGAIDVEGLARRWAAGPAAPGIARLSPRDTARGTAAGASIEVDYSRPLARGRRTWGGVVPFDRVWRLGADVATHLTLDRPVRLGGLPLEAGSYTLWLVPAEDGGTLVVNRRTRIFGTQYDASADVGRVPLALTTGPPVDQLTITIEDGTLAIRWAERVYTVPIATP